MLDGVYNTKDKDSCYNMRKRAPCTNNEVFWSFQGRVLYVAAGYPGRCHDQKIWDQEDLEGVLRDVLKPGTCILADSGFKSSVACLSLFKDSITDKLPDDHPQKIFNSIDASQRVIAEQGFGRITQSFDYFWEYICASDVGMITPLNVFALNEWKYEIRTELTAEFCIAHKIKFLHAPLAFKKNKPFIINLPSKNIAEK